MGLRWNIPPQEALKKAAEEFTRDVAASGKFIAVRQAEEMEAWAKQKAPWTDDTGDARRGLHAFVDETVGPIGMIVIQHDQTLAYPIYLERDFQGRFAIIRRTIDYFQPRLQRSLQNLANLKLITKG